jgi:predicted transcriptional regulator of viral defense system
MNTQRQLASATTEAFLDGQPVFSRAMFTEAHGEGRPSSALVERLKHLQSRGRVVSLERGLYATVRPGQDPEAVAPDPYLAGAALRPDGVFAYHSALTLLGAGHSDWRVVTLLSKRRRRPLELRNARVEILPHPVALVRKEATELGVGSLGYLHTTLRVTGRERTLVDGFRQPRLVGGIGELVTSAGGLASLDFDLLWAVLDAYDLRILYAAVGWFLETYRAHFFVPDEFLLRLEARRPASPHYLPRQARREGDGGRLVPRWNLILPGDVLRGAERDEPQS